MSLARILRVVALLPSILVASCRLVDPEADDRLTLHVDAVTAECVALAPQRCLRVRLTPDREWTHFHDPIAGFTHQPGYRYTLLVARRRVREPAADASVFSYRLVRVLERTLAPAG